MKWLQFANIDSSCYLVQVDQLSNDTGDRNHSKHPCLEITSLVDPLYSKLNGNSYGLYTHHLFIKQQKMHIRKYNNILHPDISNKSTQCLPSKIQLRNKFPSTPLCLYSHIGGSNAVSVQERPQLLLPHTKERLEKRVCHTITIKFLPTTQERKHTKHLMKEFKNEYQVGLPIPKSAPLSSESSPLVHEAQLQWTPQCKGHILRLPSSAASLWV